MCSDWCFPLLLSFYVSSRKKLSQQTQRTNDTLPSNNLWKFLISRELNSLSVSRRCHNFLQLYYFFNTPSFVLLLLVFVVSITKKCSPHLLKFPSLKPTQEDGINESSWTNERYNFWISVVKTPKTKWILELVLLLCFFLFASLLRCFRVFYFQNK